MMFKKRNRIITLELLYDIETNEYNSIRWGKYNKKQINGSYRGYTPLMLAIEKKWGVKYIEKIIGFGANVNIKNGWQYNKTPIFFAVSVGNLDVLKLLVEYGADINYRAYGITDNNNAASCECLGILHYALLAYERNIGEDSAYDLEWESGDRRRMEKVKEVAYKQILDMSDKKKRIIEWIIENYKTDGKCTCL